MVFCNRFFFECVVPNIQFIHSVGERNEGNDGNAGNQRGNAGNGGGNVGNGVEMRGIKVRMREMRVGMLEMRVGIREWNRIETRKKTKKNYKIQFSFFLVKLKKQNKTKQNKKNNTKNCHKTLIFVLSKLET